MKKEELYYVSAQGFEPAIVTLDESGVNDGEFFEYPFVFESEYLTWDEAEQEEYDGYVGHWVLEDLWIYPGTTEILLEYVGEDADDFIEWIVEDERNIEHNSKLFYAMAPGWAIEELEKSPEWEQLYRLGEQTYKAWKSQKTSTKTISIAVRNPLEGPTEWVDLPIAESELDEIMNEITFDGERDYEIADYEGISKLPTQNPWKLNELAEQLDSPEDVEKFEFLLDMGLDTEEAIRKLRSGTVAVYDSKFEYIAELFDSLGETWDTDKILSYVGRIPDLLDMIYKDLQSDFPGYERNGRIYVDR